MYVTAVFLPLVGSLIAGILAFVGGITESSKKKSIDLSAQLVTVGAMLLSGIAAIFAFIDVVVNGNTTNIHLWTWVNSGSLEYSW